MDEYGSTAMRKVPVQQYGEPPTHTRAERQKTTEARQGFPRMACLDRQLGHWWRHLATPVWVGK